MLTKEAGVVGLFQPGVPSEVTPSLSVRFMGINRKAMASIVWLAGFSVSARRRKRHDQNGGFASPHNDFAL
jgi:Phage capsid-like protein